MKKGDRLFVYGTLRRGERANAYLKPDQVRYVGDDEITGIIYDLGSFPGVKAEPGTFDIGAPHVKGDVYVITDPSIIPILDYYEGYPSLYDRIETGLASGDTAWVYTYNYAVDHHQIIPSGDWKRRNQLPPQEVEVH